MLLLSFSAHTMYELSITPSVFTTSIDNRLQKNQKCVFEKSRHAQAWLNFSRWDSNFDSRCIQPLTINILDYCKTSPRRAGHEEVSDLRFLVYRLYPQHDPQCPWALTKNIFRQIGFTLWLCPGLSWLRKGVVDLSSYTLISESIFRFSIGDETRCIQLRCQSTPDYRFFVLFPSQSR